MSLKTYFLTSLVEEHYYVMKHVMPENLDLCSVSLVVVGQTACHHPHVFFWPVDILQQIKYTVSTIGLFGNDYRRSFNLNPNRPPAQSDG